jgi:hypothetical protein
MVDLSSNPTLPTTVLLLGYAGLIPFFALLLLPYFGAPEIALLLPIVNAYAFGIISFMCGTWWRADTEMVAKTSALILSNCLFLISFFAFVLLPKLWPLFASVLLLLLFVLEHCTQWIGSFTSSYRRMRGALSIVASMAMLFSFVFLS